MRAAAVLLASLAVALPALAGEATRLVPAAEARQGVAADARHLYAVDNSAIGKYDKATGRRIGGWTGDPARFPHINSCVAQGRELVCAASNYPATPQVSSVEIFDAGRMTHRRSVALGPGIGSLTWVVRHDGGWLAMFANYDDRGGDPGRDHRWTTLVRFDHDWRRQQAWTLPASVLDRMKPRSSSGGVVGDDGLLYITGHDAPEVYVLRLPRGGAVLEHLATLPAPFEGQAIAWDPSLPRTLWGIRRKDRAIVAMSVPAVRAP